MACYALICRRVWRRQIPGSESAVPAGLHGNSQLRKSKIRALRMVAIVVAAFALSWLPLYLTFSRLKFYTDLSETEHEFWRVFVPIAQWMSSANSCVNPVLYHFLDPRFRTQFRQLLSGNASANEPPPLVRQVPLRARRYEVALV